MPALIYAPEVTIHIARANGEIIDVSDDIASGSVTRNLGPSPSRMEVTLLNAGRKYDGLFTPMDRVVVYMRRLRRLLVFSGYLDTVPVFAAYAGSIRLTASCTLKRIQHFMWDPHTAAATALFHETKNTAKLTDGGLAKRTVKLLHEVAGWPKEQIHIAGVPDDWFEEVTKVADRLIKQAEKQQMIATVGSGSYLNGTNPVGSGSDSVPGIGPGTGTLPGQIGRISWFGGPGGGAYGNMALTGESGTRPRDPWYAAMRFPYQRYSGGSITPIPGVNVSKAIAWWRNRRILVVNPKTGKAVCVRAADWGPGGVTAADNRIIDVSKTALDALGASTDTTVHVAFAPDGMALGPQRTSASADMGAVLQSKGVTSWGNPADPGYARENIVSVTVAGISFQVHRSLAGNFEGLVKDLVAAGYRPKSIGGYNRRNIAGTSKWSNHAYGAAIDIDPSSNPLVVGGTAPYTLPSNSKEIAAKWGLGWGGDPEAWVSRKDYMHFEAVNGPSSAPYKGIDASSIAGGVAGGGEAAPIGMSDVGTALFNVWQWMGNTNYGGELLSGIRALMNDTSLLNTVDQYLSAGMRHYCSAPNGDFIAWFPDYFGHYGTAAKMVIQDIEIENGFAVGWSDAALKTHMFVTSSSTGLEGLGDASAVYQQLTTAGIASVQFPELMRSLFKIDPGLFKDGGKAFLNRFGARPAFEAMDQITGGRQEFFFACHKFMLNWAQQYSARPPLTFMPEIYPGMLLVFPRYGVQGYVESVTHTFDTSNGFSTQPTVLAWSTVGKNGIKGLPRGAALK